MDRTQIIEKLTNGSEKAWVNADSSSNTADRNSGDKKYVFAKNDMKFSIWVCNHTLIWECKEIYSWYIQYDLEKKYTLLIDGQACLFSFDRSLRYLNLKLPRWQSSTVLK